LGQDFEATLWIGLDWIHELMDWIGLGQQKWTHVQLCVVAPSVRLQVVIVTLPYLRSPSLSCPGFLSFEIV